MNRSLSIDSREDRRFLWGKRVRGAEGIARILLFAGLKDGAKQLDFKQDGRERVECGGVSPLGALHSDAEAERGFGEAVVEQDYARDDLKRMALDAIEDTLDVMDKNHGILKGMQLIGADARPEAESSKHAGQATYIDCHAEVAPQERARIGAIGGQVTGVRVLTLPAGYNLQSGIIFRTVHACTSARSRVQTCKKETGPSRRSEASALAHGAHCVRSLPERRTQMFPQRSQYFSSILRNCDVLDIAFIVPTPPAKKTCRRQQAKIAGEWTPDKDRADADDRARFVCDDLFDMYWLETAHPSEGFAP
jgi:hypothetical protein